MSEAGIQSDIAYYMQRAAEIVFVKANIAGNLIYFDDKRCPVKDLIKASCGFTTHTDSLEQYQSTVDPGRK